MAIDKVWIYDTSGFEEKMPWVPALHEGTPRSIIEKLHKKWKVEGDVDSWRDHLADGLKEVEVDHPIRDLLKNARADADMRAVAALDYAYNRITLQGFKNEGEMVNCKERENAWLDVTTPKFSSAD